ncbi:MAG: HAMP domain-containing histidine kinase [Lawsonibacter sp.]|nr:HAMP domain-containing histidine kinase [Lawsonibacter sp.]
MLKQLRLKFVCINMALLTAMLCVILGLVVRSTQAGLEAESVRMMQAAAAPGRPTLPGERPGALPLPYLIVRSGRDGRYSVVWGPGYSGLSEEELRSLIDRALQSDAPTGVLADWQLRFLKADGPEKCLVFADIRQERAALAQLTRTCMLAGAAGFVVLLLISLILARWAIRPVERAWEQQRQFVADASHELKTPLTVILTNAELLANQDSTAQYAQNILIMSRQMRQLVERLLDLARADSGQRAPVLELVDLSALAEQALLPFEPVFFEAGLTLSSQIQPGITLEGSGQQLRQAADILLDNARKYASPGGTVEFSLRRTGRRQCLLSVSNPGEALSQSQLKDMFKRFYRADPARSREGGFGLGLSIAKEIVSAHRGKIWAEYRDGAVILRIELPVRG